MKLFVSDLDGTLYPPNVTDSGAENRAAIQRWRAAGNVFTVATARIHQAYPKVSADLGFAVDYLGGNGAELIFSDGTRMTRTLKAAVFLDVAGWLARHHVDATVKMNCQGQWISSDCRHYPYGLPHRLRRSLLDSVTLAETTVDPNAEILNLGIIIRPDQRDGVKRALREKLAGTTTFIIAQRVTSVQDADRIIVLNDGRIDAVGTHEELLATNEIYREVYESQQKGVA